MRSTGIAAALILALAATAQAADPIPVRVHIVKTYESDGFKSKATDRRADSAKDVEDAIHDKKGIVLVSTPEEAQVVIEVQGSGREATGREVRSADVFASPGTREAEKASTVRLKLTVGTHDEITEGSSTIAFGAWKEAAKEASRKALGWIGSNRERITAKP